MRQSQAGQTMSVNINSLIFGLLFAAPTLLADSSIMGITPSVDPENYNSIWCWNILINAQTTCHCCLTAPRTTAISLAL